MFYFNVLRSKKQDECTITMEDTVSLSVSGRTESRAHDSSFGMKTLSAVGL